MNKQNIVSYQFNADEIFQLKQYRDNQNDARLKMRFVALLMIAQDIDIDIAANIVGKSSITIERWLAKYTLTGIDSLNSFQYVPKKSFLNEEQTKQLVDWVRETNPSKIKEIKQYIYDCFDVMYSIEGVRQLLKKKGFKLITPKIIPGNPPSEEEQRRVVEEYFEMKSSSEPGSVFLFGDGMHLVHQNVPSLCWGDPKMPPVHKTNTGRKRLNILGAYDPDRHSFVHLTDEDNCNAEKVILFLEVIQKAYPYAPKIVLILDNATYFKAKSVREWLQDHQRLHLNFLPPYSPNLNLVERFWRFVKEKLVKNTYYEKYKTFRAKTFQLINHIDKHKDELKTLMVEKFEIIKRPCTNNA